MKVNSRVKIDTRKIKQLTQASITALEQTAEALHTEVVQAQVVPRMDGVLQGEQFFADYSESNKGKVSLIHATPYARRLYYHPEYNFHKGPWTDSKGKKHDGNPNAQGKWFEPWIDGDKKDFYKKAFKEFYRRAGGL